MHLSTALIASVAALAPLAHAVGNAIVTITAISLSTSGQLGEVSVPSRLYNRDKLIPRHCAMMLPPEASR